MHSEELHRKSYMIDQVVSMDLPHRRVVRKLYDAAINKTDGLLCLSAAKVLAEKVQTDDTVIIITGFPVLPQKVYETDGPPGAKVLADVLTNIGAEPIIVSDKLCINVMRAISPKNTRLS